MRFVRDYYSFLEVNVTMNVSQQIVNAISLGAVYGLFSLGYAMVFSVLGVLNLAHSAIFMWGAFMGLLVVERAHLPIWVAFPAAMLGAGLMSVVLERVAFYMLRRRDAPRISQLISSIGASILLVSIAEKMFQSIFHQQLEGFPEGIVPRNPIAADTLPFTVTPIQVVILIVALALMFLLQYTVTRTRTGSAMRAVAFNERIAALLGIHVGNIFMLTFFIAGALAGAAGVLFGLAFNVTPSMGDDIALIGLTAMVLGGLGSIQGTVAGGFIVALLQTFSTALLSSSARNAVVFIILFIILIIRPQGLMGQADATRA